MALKFTNDERFNLARGLILDATSVNKFGATPSMAQNTTGTIWDIDDTLYPWNAWTTPGPVTILTVNASDNGKVVTLQGLDENYNLASEDITVSSSGSSTGTQTFSRLFRGFVSSGSGTNVGDITVQIGGTTVLQINADFGQTLMSVYTVPSGYTGYLTQLVCSTEKLNDITGNLFIRPFNGVFRISHTFEVSYDTYFYKFDVPLKITEKSDIDFRASTRTNNFRITAAFDLILLRNT